LTSLQLNKAHPEMPAMDVVRLGIRFVKHPTPDRSK
jgi:hypothetical protein